MLSYFSQRIDSMSMLQLSDGDHQLQVGPLARRRVNAEGAAKLLRPALHILQPVSSSVPVCGRLLRTRVYKPSTVIPDFHYQPVAREIDAERDRRALGVSSNVIDGFFKDQKQVSALLRIELDLLQLWRDLKLQLDFLLL